MVRTRAVSLLVLTLFLLLAMVSGYSCGKEDPETIARNVSREWTNSQIDRIADTLATAAVGSGSFPGVQQVATLAIKSQINKKIDWTYTSPVKVSENRYQVTATAASPVAVPVQLVERTFQLSGSFLLEIDVKSKSVASWKLDPSSFRFR
jgi:hypothetical protein